MSNNAKKAPIEFLQEIHTFCMSITPSIDKKVVWPNGVEDDGSDTWKNVYDNISCDMNKEQGVVTENAMNHSFSFTFQVELLNGNSIKKTQEKVYNAFKMAWNKHVIGTRVGVSLDSQILY